MMKNAPHKLVIRELHDLIAQHFQQLVAYDVVAGSLPFSVPDRVVQCVEFLSAACATLPSAPPPQHIYIEVSECRREIGDFLELVGCGADELFEDQEISRILTQARAWCEAAKNYNEGVATNTAWEVIAPVKPDHLTKVSADIFEARWWKPVPWMDIEILRRTEGVIIEDEKVNPDDLPGGIAVRFVVRKPNSRDYD